MKSTINTIKEAKVCEKPFPKLMSYENITVLFHTPKCGVVVADTSGNCEIGYYCNDWQMKEFTDLPDDVEITLSNGDDDE